MMRSVVVSVRLDERLVRALDGAASGRERSEVIREALEEWVRRRNVTEMVREHEEGYRRSPVQKGEFDWLLEATSWPEEAVGRIGSVPRPIARAKSPSKKRTRAPKGKRSDRE